MHCAVKMLHSSCRADFEREVKALPHVSSRKNDHLINLLATFTHQGRHHLVFPWAEGDLRSFWKQVPAPPRCTLWISEQIYGLATGLQQIHYPTINDRSSKNILYGSHGDLKPENILWFDSFSTLDDQPILKISDFGSTSFHSASSWSKISPDELGGTRTYRSPECDLPSSNISPAYDMWSLACVYLEFLVWFRCGWQGITAFKRCRLKSCDTVDMDTHEDNFFAISRDQSGHLVAQLKPGVLQVRNFYPTLKLTYKRSSGSSVCVIFSLQKINTRSIFWA